MSGNPILIIDGHLDMAFNALFYRRDLTRPVRVLRSGKTACGPASLSTPIHWKGGRGLRGELHRHRLPP